MQRREEWKRDCILAHKPLLSSHTGSPESSSTRPLALHSQSVSRVSPVYLINISWNCPCFSPSPETTSHNCYVNKKCLGPYWTASNPIKRWVLFLYPLCRWNTWGTGRYSNLPKATQPLWGWARVQTQRQLLWALPLCPSPGQFWPAPLHSPSGSPLLPPILCRQGDFLKIQIWPCHWCFIPLQCAPRTLPKIWSPSAPTTPMGSLTTVPLALRTSYWLSSMFLDCTMNSVDSHFESGWPRLPHLYSRSSLPFIWLLRSGLWASPLGQSCHICHSIIQFISVICILNPFFLNCHDFLFLYTWHQIAPSTGTNWWNTAHHSVSTHILWVHFSHICKEFKR